MRLQSLAEAAIFYESKPRLDSNYISSQSMTEKRPPIFTSARIVARGPEGKNFVKAIVDDNSEIYLYNDDDNTVDVKEIPIGEDVEIRNVRFVDKPGQTKYNANAHHISNQSENIRAIFLSSTGKNSHLIRSKNSAKNPFRPSSVISVSKTKYRYEIITALAFHFYGNTKNARSRMAGDMADHFIQTNPEAVEEAFRRKKEWEESQGNDDDSC